MTEPAHIQKIRQDIASSTALAHTELAQLSPETQQYLLGIAQGLQLALHALGYGTGLQDHPPRITDA